MNKNMLSLIALLAVYSCQAGVHVVVDANETTEAVKENQVALIPMLVSFNEKNGTQIRWQDALFSPHWSLCFVNQNQRSAEETEGDFPGIGSVLQEVANENESFDIAIDEKTKIEWFEGKFEVMCGNSKKKNYKTAVLKLESPALTKLANEISNKFKEKFNIIQRFPFSAHLTLGKVYDENDQPLTPQLQEALNNHQAVVTKAIAMKITEFKLKGHDGSEKVFKLSDRA